MKYLYYLLLLLLPLLTQEASAQQHEDMVALIYAQKPHEVIALGRNYLKRNINDASAHELMGQAYYELHNYDSMIYSQKRSLELDKEKTLISCWAHITLGRYYHLTGQKEKARMELEASINKKATEKMRKFSLHLLRTYGLDGYYNNWYTAETEHIIFHFQDTLGVPNYKEYMKAHESAYTTINTTFQARTPKKLDFFCWNDKNAAKEFLMKPIGFTSPHQCITHAHNGQTKGHEITHTLVYWGWDTISTNSNRLINEGVAVAFDMTMYDKFSRGREAIKNIYIGDIKNIWLSPTQYSEEVLYPLAGALVFFLRSKSTPKQFKRLIKNQDMESAKLIYGEDFNKLMTEFNELLGIK